jgi:signal peptidase II
MKCVPRSRYLVFFSIAAIGCAADLWTKQRVFSWLGMPGGETRWLWTGVAGFQTSLNEGALFGMGQGWTAAFVVLSAISAAAILYSLFFRGAARDLFLTVALACVVAGILGNLYDRLGLPGLRWNFSNPPFHHVGDAVYAVRDWIRVVIVRFDWPNFNLADSLLVCGCLLLLRHIWKMEKKGRQSGRT